MIFEPKAKMAERPELRYLFQARRQLAGRRFNRNVRRGADAEGRCSLRGITRHAANTRGCG